MPVIGIKQWVPDAADLANPGAIDVRNVVPGVNSHKSIGSLVSSTDALGARPRGAIEAKDYSGNVRQYSGDADTLYSLSGSTWSDVTRTVGGAYATASGERWDFARWKNKVLATNFSDAPQEITMGAANFADLTSALRFRYITVIRDNVFGASTWDSTDGEIRDRVRWSAFDDETDWVVSSVTGSDVRTLNVGGAINQIFGGQFGAILSEEGAFRVTWAGAPTFYNITLEAPGIGSVGPGAGASLGSNIYLASNHGFQRFVNATTMEPIGVGFVDQFFADDFDQDSSDRVYSVADPRSGRIYWAYPGAGNTGGRPNRIMVYDSGLNKWAIFDQECELIWRSGGVATTLEGLDAISSSLDDLPVSLDDARWKGGAPLFSGFNTSFESGSFNGTPMTATIETRETELIRGREAMIKRFCALVDGSSPSVTAEVGTRNRLNSDVVWTPANPKSDGGFTTRKSARYFRFRLTVSGDWDDVIGVQIDDEDIRPGSRRG